jgi:hypothetical protein
VNSAPLVRLAISTSAAAWGLAGIAGCVSRERVGGPAEAAAELGVPDSVKGAVMRRSLPGTVVIVMRGTCERRSAASPATAHFVSDQFSLSVFADAAGVVRAEQLPAGEYRVSVRSVHHMDTTVTLAVHGAQPDTVRLTLRPRPGCVVMPRSG